MINTKLREFDCDVIARGQISYGDVRRLQRDYLPSGITQREELDLLISLNAKVVRADKAWTQWLVASVAEFVSKQEVREYPIKEAASECVSAASSTTFGRKIVRQIRRELGRRQGIQSTSPDKPAQKSRRSCGIQQPSKAGAPENMTKRPCRVSDERPARSGSHRRAVEHGVIPGAIPLAVAEHASCLAGHLPAVQRSHLINFQNSRVSLFLAPCL
jgi:hypothetical protein